MVFTKNNIIRQICGNWYFYTNGVEVARNFANYDFIGYNDYIKNLVEIVKSDPLYEKAIKPRFDKEEYKIIFEVDRLFEDLTPIVFKILDIHKKKTDLEKDFKND